MKPSIPILCLLALSLSHPRGEAQQLVERSRVKQNQEVIFNSPELRYLKSLRQTSRSPHDPFQRGRGNPGEPPDRAGNLDGGQGENQAGRGNQPNDRRNDAGDRRNARPPGNDRDDRGGGAGGRNRSSAGTPPSGGSFGAGAAGIFQFLGYLAIAAMIAAVVVLIVRSFLDRERTLESEFATGAGSELGELEPERPSGLTPSEEFVRQARELARRGEFREAVALLVLGAMSEVERRGLIRYRRGLTQRDYFRALRPQRDLAANYRQMVRIYEPLGFGRRTATEQHFQDTLHCFEAGFRERDSISED